MTVTVRTNKLPFVSVIVCTQNRKEYLEDYALSSLFASSYPHYEVVVVNDASNDKTGELLRAYQNRKENLKVVTIKVSQGISYARQVGVNHARGEIIVFIDDDCLVDRDCLAELVAVHLSDEHLMAIGGFVYDRETDQPFVQPGEIIGCNMSLRREVFDQFSFDRNFFFHRACYHEETDLVERIKLHHYKTGYAPKAVVRHLYGPASYRKINRRIGSHMDWIYMNAKQMSVAGYYAKFFKRAYQMYKLIKELYREGLISLFVACRNVLWAVLCLLFELPLKAKITHGQEERMFKKKKAHSSSNF